MDNNLKNIAFFNFFDIILFGGFIMSIKLYVGHEVVLRKGFSKFGYQNNSTSCYFSDYYFISRKCVLLQRDSDGNYIYFNNRNKCNIIDPNDLQVSINILGCNQCNLKNNDGNCNLNADTPSEFLGVLDVQPIESFTKTTDFSLAISLVKEYNSKIIEKDEYVYVDDLIYRDTIREIDDSIFEGKIKKLEKNKIM